MAMMMDKRVDQGATGVDPNALLQSGSKHDTENTLEGSFYLSNIFNFIDFVVFNKTWQLHYASPMFRFRWNQFSHYSDALFRKLRRDLEGHVVNDFGSVLDMNQTHHKVHYVVEKVQFKTINTRFWQGKYIMSVELC